MEYIPKTDKFVTEYDECIYFQQYLILASVV